MCGIFAHLLHGEPRQRQALLETLLAGLRAMEYAGCDSAGVALDDEATDGGILIRGVGGVSSLEALCVDRLSQSALQGRVMRHVGLAHTRWATHGAPSEANAHPQPSDPDHGFLVVHNGLLPNYGSLRTALETQGHIFASETDTECIAKLCLHFYQAASTAALTPGVSAATFPELMLDVVSQLQGPYGIVVKSRFFPGEMIATKRGSTLVLATSTPATLLGLGGPALPGLEVFVASDAACLMPYSAKLVFLEDEDLLHVKDGVVTLYNLRDPSVAVSPFVKPGLTPKAGCASPGPVPLEIRHLFGGPPAWSPCCSPAVRPGSCYSPSASPHPGLEFMFPLPRPQAALRPISRQAQVLDLEVDTIMKGAFPHFLLKEIFEQPESLKNVMRGRLSNRRGTVVLGGLLPYREMLCKARRLLFVATGSGFYAALAVRRALEEMVRVPVDLERAPDFLDHRPPIFRDDACFFISSTGENADVLAALQYCRSKGALCLGITNQVGSSLSRLTDCGVYLHAGFELGVTSTKTFSSLVLVLLMVALVLSEDRKDLKERRMEIIQAMQRLPEAVYATLQALRHTMKDVAQEFAHRHNFLFMARGAQMATCLEGALKLNETALVHGEGIHLGELKHGPLALVDEHMPVVLICTRDGTADRDALYPRAKSSLQQVLARHGRPIVIVNHEDPEITAAVHRVVRVPQVLGCLEAVINILPFQLLAYHLGVLKGCNVDGPRYSDH